MALKWKPLFRSGHTACRWALSFQRSTFPNNLGIRRHQRKIQALYSPFSTCFHLLRSFRTINLDTTMVVPQGSYDMSSFQDLGIKTSLCKALKREGITVPTLIQAEALPITLARRNHCILQAETGTGKTLAFLLPALQDLSPGLTTLILVPTRELAVQMHHWAVTLAGKRKDSRRVVTVLSGVDDDHMREYTEIRPHILIGTPKRILELLETNLQDFTALRWLVLDEVDKILQPLGRHAPVKQRRIREDHPRPGSLVVKKILSLRRRRNVYLMCASATVSSVLRDELEELGWGPDAELVSTTTTRNLALPSSIKHEYVVCSDSEIESEGMDKSEALLEHFHSTGEKSALVFIHRSASIMEFVNRLKQKGVNTEALYTKMLDPKQYSKFLGEFKSGQVQLVVGTEETVRGLDFTWLNTVYLMEVPRNATEYLHLSGRVGRLGKAGRTVVFVSGDRDIRRLLLHYTRLGVQAEQVDL